MPSVPPKQPSAEDYAVLLKRCEALEEEVASLRMDSVMLQNLMTRTPDNIYFKDLDSRFINICASNVRYLGFAQLDSVVGKTDFDIFDAGHAQQAFDTEQSIIVTGQPVADIVEREVWRDGRITWVSTTKAPLINAEGEIIGTFGISRDITKRVETEHKLEQANALMAYERNLMQTIMDLVPDSIYVKDENRKFVFSNKKHFESLGFTSRDQIIGKTDADFFPPGLFSEFALDDDKVIAEDISISNKEECGIDVVTGEDLWLSTSKVSVRMADFIGLVGWTRNITELKQSMLRIDEARHEAERANNLKNEFLAKMSHEIRTPLNGILGMSELMLDTKLDDSQHFNVTLIKDSAELLLTIIGDLLDFSLIETGNLALNKSKFDLHTLVDGVVTSVFFEYEHTQVDVTCAIDANVPQYMVGDPARLRQILINLIGNAKKFTKVGYIAINVSIVSKVPGKIKLLFEIDDSGFGIAVDKIDKVFESFTQADGSITRKYGGTGLGLAITKDLVGLMGGEVWAQSPSVRRGMDKRGGHGSTFSFTAEFTTKQSDEGWKRKKGETTYRVLYIQEGEINKNQFARALAGGVFQVAFVDNIELALEYLNSHKVHAVVFDEQYLDAPNLKQLSGYLIEHAMPSMLFGSRQLLREVETLYKKGVTYFVEKPMRCGSIYDGLLNLVGKKTSEIMVAVNAPRDSFIEALRNQAINKKVLVAEDNLVNQKIVTALLENIGLEPDVVSDGKEALEAIKNQQYDLVLMDVQMPVMDGLSATKLLRKESAFSELRIIAVTAQAMAGDVDECLAAGMNDYISKPLTKDKFYKLLYKWLVFR